MKSLGLSFITLFFAIALQGQQVEEDTTIIVEDSFAVENTDVQDEDETYSQEDSIVTFLVPDTIAVRFFPMDTIMAFRKKKEYAYINYIDSVLQNIQPQAPPKSSSGIPFSFLKMIYWIIAIGAIFFVIVRLLGGYNGVFGRSRKQLELNSDLAQSTALPDNNLALAKIAAENQDFRLATRYLYLYILEKMGEQNLLIVSPQKTNYEYLQQLKGQPNANDFAALTLHYEYIWYGGFLLNNNQFHQVQADFLQFDKKWL